MNDLQDKWNKRYEQSTDDHCAAEVLSLNQHLLPSRGLALDLACGLGANTLLLAQRKLQTQAWDISSVALGKLQKIALSDNLHIETLQRDVEKNPPPKNSFDVIVVCRFLCRPLCKDLIQALRPGGLLFYQTFHVNKMDTDIGPSNADFLLQPGELLSLFSALNLVVYREEFACGDATQGLRNEAYLIGKK